MLCCAVFDLRLLLVWPFFGFRLWESKCEIQTKTKIVYSNFFNKTKSIHYYMLHCIEKHKASIFIPWKYSLIRSTLSMYVRNGCEHWAEHTLKIWINTYIVGRIILKWKIMERQLCVRPYENYRNGKIEQCYQETQLEQWQKSGNNIFGFLLFQTNMQEIVVRIFFRLSLPTWLRVALTNPHLVAVRRKFTAATTAQMLVIYSFYYYKFCCYCLLLFFFKCLLFLNYAQFDNFERRKRQTTAFILEI